MTMPEERTTMVPAPRSSAQLFPDSMRLSPKQREVLDALQRFPQGAGAGELAEVLGMHTNTVRGHLGELIQAGAVRSLSKPARGRGRPALVFQVRVPDNQALAKEYISLIELLAAALEDAALEDKEPPAGTGISTAHAIGRRWAKALMDGDAGLFQRLRDMGFDPVLTHDMRIDLNACPFVGSTGQPSPFVCAIHAGFLAEIDSTLTLEPGSGPGQCAIHLRPA